jgi:hypothetical protein
MPRRVSLFLRTSCAILAARGLSEQEGDMAGKLRRLPEEVTITAERFEIELDDDERRAFAADPRGFLYDFLAKEGAPAPNAVLVGGPVDVASVRQFVPLIHINSGPFRSYYFWPEQLQ